MPETTDKQEKTSSPTTTTKRPDGKRRQTRIDEIKAVALHNEGMSQREIASQLGCSRSGISDLLARINHTKAVLDEVRKKRADIFVLTHAKTVEGINKTVDILTASLDDHNAGKEYLSTDDITKILRALTTISGKSYEHSRLEEGKSTANMSHQFYAKACIDGDTDRAEAYKEGSVV